MTRSRGRAIVVLVPCGSGAGSKRGAWRLAESAENGGDGARDTPCLRAVVFDPLKAFCDEDAAKAARAGVDVVGRATSVRGALSLLGRLRPDMLLTAGGIPTDRESWSFFGRAAGVDSDLRSVILVGEGDEALERALGAAAIAHHEHPQGHEPRPLLTRREREVISLAAPGRSNAAIARILWVTPDTVKFHLANAYRKLGVHGKAEAVQAAMERGLI